MDGFVDFHKFPVSDVLDDLLRDHTTHGNIIWATDEYAWMGDKFKYDAEITSKTVLLNPCPIQTRYEKNADAMAARTKAKGEVATPAWVCNKMNNTIDCKWFVYGNPFNVEKPDHTWVPTDENVSFPSGRSWMDYVDHTRLEITCGEAPYLVSRYDAVTGDAIYPLKGRIGIIDRKLRVVGENFDSYDEWAEWAVRAYKSSYGYEYQGDNVLIARVNLFMTFYEYHVELFDRPPAKDMLHKIADVISWNVWQMDGLTDCIPRKRKRGDTDGGVPCLIYDWQADRAVEFSSLKSSGWKRKPRGGKAGKPARKPLV